MPEAKSKAKKEVKKEEKKFWKITGPHWGKSVLRLKETTSDRSLESIKSKKGYKVEEA